MREKKKTYFNLGEIQSSSEQTEKCYKRQSEFRFWFVKGRESWNVWWLMSFKKKHFLFQKRTKREEVNIIIGKKEKLFFLFSQSDDGHDDDDGRHCHTCCTKSEREREIEKKSLFLSVPIHPLVLFIQFFWPCVGWKGKKKKKWCADSFMAVGECTRRRRRMESLVLFFLFYCVPTTLLVPPHLSLDISWQGEWLAQKEEVEKRTDLSLFFFFLDIPFIIYLRMRPQKLLPLTFFFFLLSWRENRFKMTLIRFFFPSSPFENNGGFFK